MISRIGWWHRTGASRRRDVWWWHRTGASRRRDVWWGFGAALAATFALGCDDLATCAEHGDTKSCECSNGGTGQQVCLPERIWGECDCGGAGSPVDGGSAGASGASGASGTSGAAGMSGTGGTTPAPDAGDEDAGMEPEPGGTGGAGTSGAGAGGAGTGGAGAGGTTAPMSASYRGCTSAGDCDDGATCEMSPADFMDPLPVCAPGCSDAPDCPVPEGSYEADVVCVEGRCRLDCTTELIVQQTCPAGMTCVADDILALVEYCYDDGV